MNSCIFRKIFKNCLEQQPCKNRQRKYLKKVVFEKLRIEVVQSPLNSLSKCALNLLLRKKIEKFG